MGFRLRWHGICNELGIAAAEVKMAYGEDEEGGESVVEQEGMR